MSRLASSRNKQYSDPIMTTPLIILAAGGTGGHVFPAEALARELLGRGYRVVLFTDQRGGKFNGDLSVPTYKVRASAVGKGLIGKLRSIAEMAMGVLQAGHLMRKLRPSAVVGFGGYPSVPTLYAASRLGIPIILHEQNAVLGRANRVMMGTAAIIATSFPKVTGINPACNARLIQTGNPVRPDFIAHRASPYSPLTDESPFRILVLGGSLGAKVFSYVVPQALALMPSHLRRRIVVVQQCRKDDLEAARAGFAGAEVEAELASFFHDVPERMAWSHLIIGRAGGSTIAEVTALGRPSILVPFPHGHAGEQTANAEAVAESGGAWLIPEQAFTAEALAMRLESLMTLPETLSKTAASARAWGRINAADNLANCVEDVMGCRTSNLSQSPIHPQRENAA